MSALNTTLKVIASLNKQLSKRQLKKVSGACFPRQNKNSTKLAVYQKRPHRMDETKKAPNLFAHAAWAAVCGNKGTG